MDNSRIAMLTAVLYRHGKLNLLGNDLYVSTIAGGIAKEPGCDLSIVAALLIKKGSLAAALLATGRLPASAPPRRDLRLVGGGA